jgi:hypothetical protein
VKLDGQEPVTYRGGILVVGLATAALLASLLADPPRLLHAPLTAAPLTFLGRVSYGVYLWHWPLLVVLGHGDPASLSAPRLVVAMGATLALASTSWFLVEQPVLRGWPRVVPGAAAIGALAAIAAVVAVVAIDAPKPQDAALALARDRSFRNVDRPDPGAADGPVRGNVLVVGDSVATTLLPGLVAYERDADLRFVSAAEHGCALDVEATRLRSPNGVGPAGDREDCQWPTEWPAAIAKVRPQLVVGLWGLWDSIDHEVDGTWLVAGSDEWNAHMRDVARRAITTLTARGARVVLIEAPYTISLDQHYTDALNAVLRAEAARWPDQVAVIRIDDELRDAERWDTVHFTEAGARTVGERLVPRLAGILAGTAS